MVTASFKTKLNRAITINTIHLPVTNTDAGQIWINGSGGEQLGASLTKAEVVKCIKMLYQVWKELNVAK
jgi:hypothetical protein